MRHLATIFIAGFASCLCLWGQQENEKTVVPESYIALLRSDLQNEKTTILTDNLKLSEDEATKFWPLQRSFENDLSKLGDERINVIREYAKTWPNLSDDLAKSLGKRLLEYHKKRVELSQKYFDRISKEVSATAAAKFFQIEIQLEDLLDLAIGSSVPLIK